MPQAIVDPEELRHFAQTLKHFSGHLANQMAVLQGQLQNLGNTWRDQEHLMGHSRRGIARSAGTSFALAGLLHPCCDRAR